MSRGPEHRLFPVQGVLGGHDVTLHPRVPRLCRSQGTERDGTDGPETPVDRWKVEGGRRGLKVGDEGRDKRRTRDRLKDVAGGFTPTGSYGTRNR